MSTTILRDIAARRVRELARTEHYHRGAACTYEDIARHCDGLPARFICEQAELAGFPVWTTAPDVALQPLSSCAAHRDCRYGSAYTPCRFHPARSSS